MEMNRKELKKIMYSFNAISSRMMRVSFDEYNMVLKKFLTYINETDIIHDYILSGNDDEYDAQEVFNKITTKDYVFDFGPSTNEESYQIYKILDYIENNVIHPESAFFAIYGRNRWQDNVKEFNDRVVLVLINNIDAYLANVGIDMGLDESMTWNVNGGQVNVANDNSTINATQNNGIDENELNSIVKSINDNSGGLSGDSRETLLNSVEMIRNEIVKPAPQAVIISNGIKLIASITTITNGFPLLAGCIQKLIDFATRCIH